MGSEKKLRSKALVDPGLRYHRYGGSIIEIGSSATR